jgi:serine/threonine protein kinase
MLKVRSVWITFRLNNAGGTLTELINDQKGRPMDESTILNYFAQIALSLHHLHTKRILHRDLKTPNILLNKSRTICKLSGSFYYYNNNKG